MSASATPASASTTNITVLGFAEWHAKRQYPDVKKKEKNWEAQDTALLNRDICVYNTAASIQNSIVFGVVTTFVLTALRILNPIAGLLCMAAGAFVHHMTTKEMNAFGEGYSRTLLQKVVRWVQDVKAKNNEKPEAFQPISHNLLDIDSFYRLAPYAKTKTEEPAEKSVSGDKDDDDAFVGKGEKDHPERGASASAFRSSSRAEREDKRR